MKSLKVGNVWLIHLEEHITIWKVVNRNVLVIIGWIRHKAINAVVFMLTFTKKMDEPPNKSTKSTVNKLQTTYKMS